jgi:hypothetical protein
VRTLLCKFLCACVCLCACISVPDWTDSTVACARAYAGLVRNATSYAFNKHIDTSKGVKAKDTVANVTLTRDDFMRALSEYKPAFGVADDAFEAYPREDIVLYAPRVQVRACACVCVCVCVCTVWVRERKSDGVYMYVRDMEASVRTRTLCFMPHACRCEEGRTMRGVPMPACAYMCMCMAVPVCI